MSINVEAHERKINSKRLLQNRFLIGTDPGFGKHLENIFLLKNYENDPEALALKISAERQFQKAGR